MFVKSLTLTLQSLEVNWLQVKMVMMSGIEFPLSLTFSYLHELMANVRTELCQLLIQCEHNTIKSVSSSRVLH